MLTVKNQEIDLGELKFGVAKEFVYEVTNSSNEDIKINKLALGCHACTDASIDKHLLKPKEKTNLNVKFTPGSTGINQKSLTVIYNTVNQLKLKFKAVVNK